MNEIIPYTITCFLNLSRFRGNTQKFKAFINLEAIKLYLELRYIDVDYCETLVYIQFNAELHRNSSERFIVE